MRISELINELQGVLDKDGDLKISTLDVSSEIHSPKRILHLNLYAGCDECCLLTSKYEVIVDSGPSFFSPKEVFGRLIEFDST